MKNKSLFILLILCLVFNASFIVNANFENEVESHWAQNAMNEMKTIGVINGDEDGVLRPDDTVTRAEFITMLFKIVCVLDETKDFKATKGYVTLNGIVDCERRAGALEYFKDKSFDTSYADMRNHWAKNYLGWMENYFNKNNIAALKDLFGTGDFNPDIEISKEAVALLCVPFVQEPIEEKEITLTDVTKQYKYYNQIALLYNDGIISGDENHMFHPTKTLSRAEAATILLKLLYELNCRHDYFEKMIGTYHFDWFEGIPIPIFLGLKETYPELYKIGYSYYLDTLQNVAGWASDVEKDPDYVPAKQRLVLLNQLEKVNYPNKPLIYYFYYYDLFYNSSLGDVSGNYTLEQLQNKDLQIDYLKKAISYIDEANNSPYDLITLYAYIIYETEDITQHEVYLKKMIVLADQLKIGGNDDPYDTAKEFIEKTYKNAITNAIAIEKYEQAIQYIDKGALIEADNSYCFDLKAYCQLKLGMDKTEVLAKTKEITNDLLNKVDVAWKYSDLQRQFYWLLKTIKRY